MLRSIIAHCLLLLVAVTFTGFASAPGKKSGPIKALLVGGGSSHDFDKWYKEVDVATLNANSFAHVEYTSDPSTILGKLADIDVLILSNNQPIPDKATRDAIFSFVNAGKGLVLLHAAMWYNWNDWPEYNKELVGGGSKGHDKYGPYEVKIKKKHAVTKNVSTSFSLSDELYYYIADPSATPVEVLADAKSPHSGKVFPSVFVVKHPKSRIVGIALGHDAASHELDAYKTLLKNAVRWAAKKK
jgi:type 1 glutamine amidotransferase